MRQAKRAKGSALLTALFIMTLVAIVATAMSTRIQLDIYRSKLMINHDRLYLASQAIQFWALGELSNKKNKFYKTNKKGLVSQFPEPMAHSIKNLTLSGGLYDLQARFNLNNLINKKSVLEFSNLLSVLLPQINEKAGIKLGLNINDWLSSYDLARGKDEYLSYYMAQKPPYYPSHQLMSSASELRLVKDISASIYLALEPWITALPESTPVNINTAPIELIKSLSPVMKESALQKLLMMRKEEGIKYMGAISELLKKLNISPDQITLDSTYFLSIAHVQSDHLNLTIYTVFRRMPDKKGNPVISIVRESFNVL